MRSFVLFTLVLGVGCNIPGGGGGTSNSPPDLASSNNNNPIGKTCTGDSECGAGYFCDISSGPGPGPGPECTPDRPCTELECEGICLAMGEFDPMTGMASQACVTDCTSNGLCCSGSGPPGTPSGTCAKSSSPAPQDMATPATPIKWAGTWNATVTYDVGCDVVGNVSSSNQSHTLTIQITGNNDSLSATPTAPTSAFEPMTGTGNDSGLTLSGHFPFRDNTGNIVTTTNNSVTIKLTSVASTNSASGTLEGTAKNRFGSSCTISNGTISFSR